jgi:D-alanyl-D-alanine carboxypeptidase
MPGSRMFIDPKMQVPVEDLVKGMIVQSGNDATVALAEGVGGSVERFVQLMNTQAKALGLTPPPSRTPKGLTEAGHTTTARDLSMLATRLMRDFPEYVGYYAVKKYRYPGTPAANDNNRNSAAVSRPDGRRPQDRPYRGRRLLPGGHCQARLSRISWAAGSPAVGGSCSAPPAKTPAPTNPRNC